MTAIARGVDVGGTHIRAVAIDRNGAILVRAEAPTPAEDGVAALGVIEALVRGLDGQGPVGVGVPGIVRGGTLASGANVTWRDLPVSVELRRRLGVRVVAENDCTAGAFGEMRIGAARGMTDALYLGVGTGIGGGLIIGGRIHRGAHGAAGEVGHTIVEPDGHPCGCGNRGCWETVASGTAITRDGRTAVTRHAHSLIAELAGGDPAAVTGEMVTRAAREGDPAARGILTEAGTRLGEGIAGLVNVLDPEVVVVGGGAAAAGELLLGPARHAYERAVQLSPPPPLAPAALGTDAAVVGAALLALEEAS
jgi:glucokinase